MAKKEILTSENFNNLRFDTMVGFNTKQLWVYENVTDTLIDPPSETLERIKSISSDYDIQERELMNEVKKNPSWLYDSDYWYSGETEV